MPGLYQKEDDKVAEYNNDKDTICNVYYHAASQNYKNLFGDLNVPQPLNNNKGTYVGCIITSAS